MNAREKTKERNAGLARGKESKASKRIWIVTSFHTFGKANQMLSIKRTSNVSRCMEVCTVVAPMNEYSVAAEKSSSSDKVIVIRFSVSDYTNNHHNRSETFKMNVDKEAALKIAKSIMEIYTA